MKVSYSPESVSDLQRLYEFIAPKSRLSARKAATEILQGAEKLKIFPRIGLPVMRAPEPDLIRDLYIGPYTIRYQIEGPEQVSILRVWHNKESEKDEK